MNAISTIANSTTMKAGPNKREEGFSLAEFLIASLVLLVTATWIFSLLAEVQQEASFQTEVLSVLNNTQSAMLTIERFFRQAGNDPLSSGLQGIQIIGPSEVRVHADIKGSAGPSNPDKGDPDGDSDDSDEDVVIRYNPRSRAIEIIPGGGSALIIANYISNLSFQYYNAEGAITMEESAVCRIGITISGSSLIPHPKTHQYFGVQLRSEIRKIT
jgi:Tfp pilus assembly protein PilW